MRITSGLAGGAMPVNRYIPFKSGLSLALVRRKRNPERTGIMIIILPPTNTNDVVVPKLIRSSFPLAPTAAVAEEN